MSFVSRRPKFPIGFPVPGFPAIERALHVENSLEIYLLESRTTSNLILLSSSDMRLENLQSWWNLLGRGSIVSQTVLLDRHAVVLEVNGLWCGTGQVWSGSSFEKLMLDVAEMAESAQLQGLRPDLRRSLLWLSQDSPRLIPVYARTEPGTFEPDLVCELAAAITWLATGIDCSAGAPLIAIESWNRSVGSHLSGILTRCLYPSADRIRSLGELKSQIGAQPRQSVPEVSAAPTPTSLPVEHRGLDKIAGMRELKELLEKEIIRPLRNPEMFRQYRISLPNGILFYGPPGCGKTYIARQLAEELGYFFLEVIPSEIASPYIHSTVLKIRKMFDNAAQQAPSILFVDEFDALVPSRAELGGPQQYKAEEVNEFLANLGNCADKKVLFIAATNEPQKIDHAVRRTGRLDKLIYIGPPDVDARAEMLRFHLAGRPAEQHIDSARLSSMLEGYSASDLKLLVEEAARMALDRNLPISTKILLEAFRRVPGSITSQDALRYASFRHRGM